MFQINELQAAIAVLEEQIAGLKVVVEWAAKGFTVDYMVDFRGHAVCSREPIPVADAPRQVADELRRALGELLPSQEIGLLIKGVEESSVSMF